MMVKFLVENGAKLSAKDSFGAEPLVFAARIADLTQPVEEHGPGQGVAGLALIGTRLDPAAELGVLQPVQDEQGTLDPPQWSSFTPPLTL